MAARKQKRPAPDYERDYNTKDYQVCIRIIEARHLFGMEVNPIVTINVGQETKKTQTKSLTNSPFYDEYFVFEFRMPACQFFDQVITLTVESKKLLFSKLIGVFKIDVATVHASENFFHKWALLVNPAEPHGGSKGYVKCDIVVNQKGEVVSFPPIPISQEEEDIEENLLMPEGSQFESSPAQYVFNVFFGQDVLSLDERDNISAMGRKDQPLRLSPYVRVLFAGLSGKTSVRKHTANPIWNESIVLIHMFPPLLRRIRVQLRDDQSNTVVATAFLDLNAMSDESVNGYLPTFGPAFLNFYGGMKTDKFHNQNPLNFGLGDGACYRGRLFLSFEVTQVQRVGRGLMTLFRRKTKSQKFNAVSVTPLKRSQIVKVEDMGPSEEFFLFCCIFEATGIDRYFADKKPLYFELSIGHHGKVLDGCFPKQVTTAFEDTGSDSDSCASEDIPQERRRNAAVLKTDQALMGLAVGALTLIDGEEIDDEKMTFRSQTEPLHPVLTDEMYCSLPFYEAKPCLFIRSYWPNDKRRQHCNNIIRNLADKINRNLDQVEELIKLQQSGLAIQKLKLAINQMVSDCRFDLSIIQKDIDIPDSSLHQAKPTDSHVPFLTELDIKRFTTFRYLVDSTCARAEKLLKTVSKSTEDATIQECRRIAENIRQHSNDPQMSMPDVFLWLCSGDQRIAYARVSAASLLYSNMDEEKGNTCGKLTSFFLKQPVTSENQEDERLWQPQAEVTAMLWFGLSEQSGNAKDGYLSNLPKGFKAWCDFRQYLFKERCVIIPPKEIKYEHSGIYELRCHFYCARDLYGLDASGLSDPFVRIIFRGSHATSQVIEQTVNPFWDETLVLPGIQIYGTPADIQKYPPKVAVQIYDRDVFSKNEMIGHFEATTVVKLAEERYAPPKYPPPMKWYTCHRFEGTAGEVLAAFELLEVYDEYQDEGFYPPLPRPMIGDNGAKLPLPDYIRPKLARFYIEGLFWGIRELKGLRTVSPMIEVEVAGQIMQSDVIANYHKNPNFLEMRKFFDALMPENPMYRPPITIRCVDCLSFGRTSLIGTHTIVHLSKHFIVESENDKERERKKSRAMDDRRSGFDDRRKSVFITLDKLDGSLAASKTSLESAASRASRISNLKSRLRAIMKAHAEGTGLHEEEDEETVTGDSPEHVDDDEANIFGEDETATETADEAAKAAEAAANSKFAASRFQQTQERQEVDRFMRSEKFKRDTIMMSYDWWTKYTMSVDKYFEMINANKVKPRSAAHLLQKEIFRKARHKFRNITETSMGFVNKAFKRDENGANNASTAAEFLDVSARPEDKFARYVTIYPYELEKVPEFGGFEDEFRTFKLYRGKQTPLIEDEARMTGKFKGNIKFCKYPVPEELQEYGFFPTVPKNETVQLTVRVYVVKAYGLMPMDKSGKADPYICVRIGSNKVSDRSHHQVQTLHPAFGRCYELPCTLPEETELVVQVWDMDRLSTDDMIGETKIDLENRYYSKHRATCGLSMEYDMVGYNEWRDSMRPSMILEELCEIHELEPPEYSLHAVKINGKTFMRPDPSKDETTHIDQERSALYALHHWHEMPGIGTALVPEHVETRPLYNPKKAGIEHGRLEMWVDIFPVDGLGPGQMVDITPRKPEEFELRVIIYDTTNVPLKDYNMLEGLHMSDIYVKAFMTAENIQSTDVHYRSLNGEGNFNWRFKFKFKYLPTEDKILVKRRENVFSLTEADVCQPCRLTLQVWDAETLTGDDQLGTLEIDLSRFPRGKKMSSNCSWRMFDPSEKIQKVSLFKLKRMRGWWPFLTKNKHGQMEDAGKVDMELELVTEEEAEKTPVGIARNEPCALDPPKRPDTSFAWFTSPLKLLRFGIWDNMKYKLLALVLIILGLVFLGNFFFNLPTFMAQKIVGSGKS